VGPFVCIPARQVMCSFVGQAKKILLSTNTAAANFLGAKPSNSEEALGGLGACLSQSHQLKR